MNINIRNTAEVLILLWVVTKSPLFAFFLLAFFIALNEEQRKKSEETKRSENIDRLSELAEIVKNPPNKEQLEEEKKQYREAEHKRAITEDNMDGALIYGSPQNFYFYGDFIIDNYYGRFYRVMDPNGNYLPKVFLTEQEAKTAIDLEAPFISVPKPKERQIYDIRFVK